MSGQTRRFESDARAGSATTAQAAGTSRALAYAQQIGPLIVGWALPFALVLYLALRRGGYDVDVWSEAGIVVWLVVLIGAMAGILPARRVSRPAWIALGLLAAFTLWTALSLVWTESADRTFDEVARLCTFLGVFALAITTQGKEGLRHALGGIAAAIVVVAGFALLSRMEPNAFPINDAAQEVVRARLNYPLNYWNGLATLMAIGVPLLLAIAAEAKHIISRALATAGLPLVALTLYFTFSRGGIIATALAVGVFFLLYPRRLAALVPGLLGAAGGAVLIGLASQRTEIRDFVPEKVPNFPNDPFSFEYLAAEMTAAIVVVAIGVALLAAAIGLVAKYNLAPRLRMPRIQRRTLQAGLAVLAIVGVGAAIAVDAPGKISSGWEEFKSPDVEGTSSARLETASGNGRYQYWGSALNALGEEPVTGIGAGTFEFWWDRDGDLSSMVVDAHSLFFETAAELGIVGLALLVAFIAIVLVVGVRRTVSAAASRRGLLAGGVGASVAFVFGMTIDWGWELAVLPVVFMLLAAPLLGDESPIEPVTGPGASERRRPVAWLALAGVAVPALAILVLSLVTARGVIDSQADFRVGKTESAVAAARTAGDAQPWAAGPRLQEALALEELGDLGAAAVAARAAVDREETNWENWITLSRIEGSLGNQVAADVAYERARSLNPRSEVFAE